jgi:hypothetical protein
MPPELFLLPECAAMTDPVHTSDNLLAEYLGGSLQSATIRLVGGLIVVAAVAALIIKLI